MALNVVELEYVTPPDAGPIFGVPIATVEQALDLFQWATTAPGFTCTLVAKLDGTQTIQIEGVTTTSVVATIGGDRWIVFDSGAFTLFDSAAEALTIYKIKGT